MTVQNKSAKVSIDFVWQHETEDGSSGFSYDIKYHHTDEYGPTITIQEDDDVIRLPASIFPEVTDFLRSKGVFIRDSGDIEVPVSTLELPVPDIEEDEEDEGDNPDAYMPIDIPEGNPVTSFGGGSPRKPRMPRLVPQPTDITEGEVVDPDERRIQHEASMAHGNVPETPEEEKEKARQMMELRRAAVARARTAKKRGLRKIAERDDVEYDESLIRDE